MCFIELFRWEGNELIYIYIYIYIYIKCLEQYLESGITEKCDLIQVTFRRSALTLISQTLYFSISKQYLAEEHSIYLVTKHDMST